MLSGRRLSSCSINRGGGGGGGGGGGVLLAVLGCDHLGVDDGGVGVADNEVGLDGLAVLEPDTADGTICVDLDLGDGRVQTDLNA